MNIALLLSGGTGTRLGADIPKQYIEVGDKPVISYSIELLSAHTGIDGIQIVAAKEWQSRIAEWMKVADINRKFRGFSVPGENRQLSVLHGLEDIRRYAGGDDNVLIHDAARPIVPEKTITECLETVREHDGVVPVLPMKDTVYASKSGKKISALLNRGEIFAGQSPEAFRLGVYYEANMELMPDRIRFINGSTEPAVLAGLDIAMIAGDEHNFKITTEADLEKFRRIVEESRDCRIGLHMEGSGSFVRDGES